MFTDTHPTHTTSESEFDSYAATTIRHKVDGLIGRYGYREDDREDLEQDLALAVWEKLPYFKERTVQRSTFISRLIDQRIADLIKSRKRACRHYERESYLTDEEGRPDNNLDRLPNPHTDERDGTLRGAIVEVLDELTPIQREICQRLGWQSQRSIVRELPLSRYAFDRELDAIREACVAHGLADHL